MKAEFMPKQKSFREVKEEIEEIRCNTVGVECRLAALLRLMAEMAENLANNSQTPNAINIRFGDDVYGFKYLLQDSLNELIRLSDQLELLERAIPDIEDLNHFPDPAA